MNKQTALIVLILLILSIGAYAAYTAIVGARNDGDSHQAQAQAQSLPPPPGTENYEALEVTENMSDLIRSVMDSLGEAPNNVVGFGMGFKRPNGTPITPEENIILRNSFDSASRRFASDKGNMGCRPTVNTDEMLAYTEGGVKGYSQDLSTFIGQAGYTEFDHFGNLDERIGKTIIHFVSIDKTVKRVSAETADALVANAQVYAYWIESIPDDNKLHGQVFNRGTDERNDEPVKQGTLKFLRIGPNPSSTDEYIEVAKDKTGRYQADGKLTAGHYQVHFDAKDGKGYRMITPNWLYLPGDFDDPANEPKNWYVLVNTTYRIIYEHLAKTAAEHKTVHTVQMVWDNIAIDWFTESEVAKSKATEAGFSGTYCLTYDYENTTSSHNSDVIPDDRDDAESEITPGYYPTTFNEVATKDPNQEIKLRQVPTLSFYRGAKDNPQGYEDDAFYMCIPAEIAIFIEPVDQVFGTALMPGIFDPMTEDQIQSFKSQGWGDFAFLGKLTKNDITALIESGTPMQIYYEHADGAFVKVLIEPYFEK